MVRQSIVLVSSRGEIQSSGRVAALAAIRLKVVRSILRTSVHQSAAAASRRRDEDTLERLAELSVEDAVDDGVHRAVDVAEPREDGEDERRDTVAAEGAEDVDGEEGDPADEEYSHDDPQGDGRLLVVHSVGP